MNCCPRLFSPRSLQFMLKRFKLAGAHPDVIASIDPKKAHDNGEQLILLENLIQKRCNQQVQMANEELQKIFHLKFWLRPQGHDLLHAVDCRFTPGAPDNVVKQQLCHLFAGAGISDDFFLPGSSAEQPRDFVSVLQDSKRVKDEFQSDTSAFLSTCEKCLKDLREFGVIVLLEDDPFSSDVYLLTMPFDEFDRKTATSMMQPGHSISPEVQDFLRSRNLQPFDLRFVSGLQAMERVVSGVQRLHRLYSLYRGKSIRTGVCYLLCGKAAACQMTADGCVRLPLSRPLDWDEYLMSLSPLDWRFLMTANSEWRAAGAVKLQAQLRSLKRLADVLHVFEVRVMCKPGRGHNWVEEMIHRFLREEAVVRNAINKYGIRSSVLKARGGLRFEEHLQSLRTGDEVAYRIQADGKIFVGAAKSTPKSVLRMLKDNLPQVADCLVRYDNAMAEIQRVSMQLNLQVGFENAWKNRIIVFDPTAPTEANFLHCVESFRSTFVTAAADLRALLLRHAQPGQMLLVSDRFQVTPQGCICVPWNVDLASFKQYVLNPR